MKSSRFNSNRRSCEVETLEGRQLMSVTVAAEKVSGDLLADYSAYTVESASEQSLVTIDAASNGHPLRLLKQLNAIGLTNGSRFAGMVSGDLPVASIGQLNSLPALKFVAGDRQQFDTTGLPAVSGVGQTVTPAVTTTLSQEGSIALGATTVRQVFATMGAGVKVGVISGSFNATAGYSQDVAAGLLPSNVTVLKDDLTKGNDDEGRAMCEVVHDVAPSAQLYFSSSSGGQAGMASSILALQKAGCKIIVDDVLYLTEPFFQNGVISRAVNTVHAAGVTYFSSAGNYGANSYQAAWHDGGTVKVGTTSLAGHAQNFATSGKAVLGDPVTIPTGQTATFVLQWDSNYASLNSSTGGSKNQLNIYLVDSTGTKIITSGTTKTIGKDPIQTMTFTNKSAATGYYVAITLASGPAPTLIKYVMNGHTGDTAADSIYIDKFNSGGAIDPHAAASGAIAVAAVEYDTVPNYTGSTILPIIEDYSSVGTDTLVFDDTGKRLAKPTSRGIQITSVDAVDVNAHKAPGFTGQFHGTSCAAPNAAALAALMLSAFPKATPAQILSAMQTSALSLSPYSTTAAAGPGLVRGYVSALTLAASFPAAAANCSISGGVYDEPYLGTVGSFPTGGPLGNVTVTLSQFTKNATYVNAGSYTTGSNGAFSFKNLRPGLYRVTQAISGYFSTDYPLIGTYTITLSAGQISSGNIFGDYVFQF